MKLAKLYSHYDLTECYISSILMTSMEERLLDLKGYLSDVYYIE